MQRRQIGWRIVAVVCLSILLAAGSATAAPITRFIVTVGGGCLCHAPMLVGVAKGIFAKYGLDIEIVRPPTGFEAMAGVAAGQFHVAEAAPAVVAQVRAQGLDLKGIFMAFGDATGKVETDKAFAVVSRRASGIREGRLDGLKGKKVGVPRGTIAHQYFFYAAAAGGLDAGTDITVQHVPPGDLARALQDGSVDAIVIWETVALRVVQTVPDAFVVYRGGSHIQFLDFRLVIPRYIGTNPGTIRRYTIAFAEAAQFTRMHPDEATDLLMNDVFFRGLSRENVRTALGFQSFDMRVSKATIRAAQQGFEFAIRIGALQRAPVFEEMVDLRILNRVLKEHPEFFKDLQPIPDDQKL